MIKSAALIFFLTVASSLPTWAAEFRSCALIFEPHLDQPRTSVEQVAKAFEEIWSKEDIYCSGRCHLNVVNLYRELKAKLPQLSEDDFNVIYITTPKRFEDYTSGFNVISPRGLPRHRIGFWRFHVVLEYRGYILDLDRSQPSISLQSEYVRDFFMSRAKMLIRPWARGLPSNLIAYKIPAPDYFQNNLGQRFDEREDQRETLGRYPRAPLSSFKDYTEPAKP